ncbi:MAG: HAMP domain-containing histidine kinase [Chloroflexi bacterium]|nr:MAG: HAMP domain-containing histidine kinase [Chloroflexota bacterium]
MRLPFGSLRTNLIAAFVAVIGVSLLLASGAFAYLLREYQVQRESDRLKEVAGVYMAQVVRMARGGASLQVISAQLDQSADDAGVRVLLLDDRGLVLHDTDDNSFAGRTFALPPNPGHRPNVYQGIQEGMVLTVASGPGVFQPALSIAVASPEQSLTNAWRDVLPRLSVAALSALLVSIGIAWWLASTITRPMMQITRASEEMAHGNLDPDLALPETNDEVGRLSKAFTIMAREVAISHRAMRDLLANASHDLRTPLTSISGFAGALVDGTLSGAEGASEAGRIIGEEAERMRRLVEDLLYLGRIQSGDLALQRDPVDLAELARAARARFLFRAQEGGTHFEVRAADPVPMLGDAHRIGQVLDNLLENAFKFTPPTGSVTVTVALEGGRPGSAMRPGRSPQTAVLSVHNTGSYIPPEEAQRVFERFYQVDKARAGNRGSGLGLSIAREIVQAHGGRIDLVSAIQTGTSFIVRLPALEIGGPTPLPSSDTARPAEVGAAR